MKPLCRIAQLEENSSGVGRVYVLMRETLSKDMARTSGSAKWSRGVRKTASPPSDDEGDHSTIFSMRILGRNSDDKGTQLEQIAQAMLVGKGYQNVRLNSVGAGGAEYDVTATWVMPGAVTERRIHVVGECKARKDPVNMSDWQKFLGKVLIEATKRRQAVSGLFIAASGFNSNVASSYEELREQRDDIELVGETDIEDFLKREYSVASLQQVASSVSAHTDRTANSIELCYYQRRCYWLITFAEGAYTILDHAGNPLGDEDGRALGELIEMVTTAGTLVNLQEEEEAKRRKVLAQKHVLARLMLYNGAVDVSVLLQDSAFTSEEILAAATSLSERGWLETSEEGLRLNGIDDGGRCEFIGEILKFWLEGLMSFGSLIEGVASQFYDRHVDEELLNEIIAIQGNLPIPPEQRRDVIRVLKLSPTALSASLHPYGLITTGRTAPGLRDNESINETDRNLFYEYLNACLVKDFKTPQMAVYYSKLRGVWELEYQQSVIVKNAQGIDVTVESRSRQTIRPSNVQGGFIHLMAMSSAPEPWEEIGARRENGKQAVSDNEPHLDEPQT